jgi:hypothetical protein
MDAHRFDYLVQSMTTSGTRRGLLRLIGVLPLSGALSSFLAEGSEAAKHRHHARQHHATDSDQLEEQRKTKPKKKCAHVGQPTSKKRKRCCAGLAKDASGLCAGATAASPPPGCTPATCAPNACGNVPDGCGGTLNCGGCAGNSLCDAGTCQPCDVCESGCFFDSMQDAIDAASAGETIRICAGLYRGTIVIDKNLTLIGAGGGNGAGSTILQKLGTDVKSVVEIAIGVTAAVHSLRITGGAGALSGGGIRNRSRLTLTDCTVTGNTAGEGGGIRHDGVSMTLRGCTVSGNTAGAGGGIVMQTTTVQLINSTVSGNTATTGSGGGILNAFGTLTLDAASQVTGNTATTRGGGILNNDGTVTLDAASRVTGNEADLNDPDSGGGILNIGTRGTVTLSSADNVSGNTPDNCGGTAVPLCVD